MEKWIILNKPYDKYAISNYGNVKNIKTDKLVKQYLKRDGYYSVSLWKNNRGKNFKVHRLVAIYFIIQNSENELYVNHIDGDKTNNFYKNLEWVTPSKNNYESVRLGLSKAVKVKITDIVTKEIMFFDSITQAALHYGLDKRCLSRALKRNGNYKNYHIEKI